MRRSLFSASVAFLVLAASTTGDGAMKSRWYCWRNGGHIWGEWVHNRLHVGGVSMIARWCERCGAQQVRGDVGYDD